MKNVTLYQTKRGCKYSFMNYEYAKENLKLSDYDEVLYFTTDADLEEIFSMGNNGKLHCMFPDNRFRSISVSDIIDVDGTMYYVDSFGFKEID